MEKTKNAVNYDDEMKKTLSALKTARKVSGAGARLLLHSCCAPCSSACLERLKDYVRVTVLYYNPNIDERSEYEKRGGRILSTAIMTARRSKRLQREGKSAKRAARAATSAINCAFLKRRNARRKKGLITSQARFR